MKMASADFCIHKVHTAKFQDEDVTLMVGNRRVWLFGRQVCPIIHYANQYNAVKRYCPGCRLLKPGDVERFILPFKFSNRGALIFPSYDLPNLVSHSKRPHIKLWFEWLREQLGIIGIAPETIGISPARPQPPTPVEPEAQENERWFKEVATYEFEGTVFTGLMDERIMPGNKKKIPGFIAHEITDAFEYENQHDSTRYLPQNTLGWYLKRTAGGFRKVRVVDERGFYQLILRANRTPKTERFQNWVYFDVLPTIRETGSYSMQPQIEAPSDDALWEALKDPVGVLRLLAERDDKNAMLAREVITRDKTIVKKEKMIEYKDQVAKTYRKEIISSQTKIRELKPKAETLDRFTSAHEKTFSLTRGSYILKYPRGRFIAWLSDKTKDRHWIYKHGLRENADEPWLPMAWTQKKGWMLYDIKDSNKDRGPTFYEQARLTEQGLVELNLQIQRDPFFRIHPSEEVFELVRFNEKAKGPQLPLFDV